MSDVEVRPITVDELIAKLAALPPEQRQLGVTLEGCDCSGPAYGIYVGRESVEIVRCEEVFDWDTSPVKLIGWKPL